MTVAGKLKKVCAIKLLVATAWLGIFLTLSLLSPWWWIEVTLHVWFILNYSLFCYQQIQRTKRLLNSPFLYLAEIENLAGEK